MHRWMATVWAMLATTIVSAHAQSSDATQTPPDFWHRDTLTGDWGGLRTALHDHGVDVTMTYTADMQGDVAGGIQRGAVYDGSLLPQINVDLEKLVGWDGASASVSMLQISGPSLSASYVGNLLNVSSINGRPSTRLYNAWLQQNAFDDVLSVRAGLMNADAEFLTTLTGSIFVNSTFGWPGILAIDLPSGGPAYPLSAPMVRLKVQPTPAFSVMAAVFSGDPTGHGGSNDPALTPQPVGTTVSFNGGVLVMAEAAYAINQEKDAKGQPLALKFGGWYHSSNRFGDQRFDNMGLSLADPSSDGEPFQHDGDWGLYASADAALWRGLSGFVRVAGAPNEQNLASFYVDGGLAYKGLLPGRADDTLGIAVAYARIGSQARALDADYQAFGNPFFLIRSAEVVLEVTYQAQLTPWLVLQPDLQAVFNQSGRVTNADGTVRPNALVVGLRMAINF